MGEYVEVGGLRTDRSNILPPVWEPPGRSIGGDR